MALSQLFWDVLMPWNLKSTYFSLKIIHFLSLNIWYVIYVVFWIKYWNFKLPHHCILFLFTICTVSQLFWNRVCTWLAGILDSYWSIDTSPGVCLTASQTNHNAESGPTNKPDGRVNYCRWTWTWKMVCIDIFLQLKRYLLMSIHVYFML